MFASGADRRRVFSGALERTGKSTNMEFGVLGATEVIADHRSALALMLGALNGPLNAPRLSAVGIEACMAGRFAAVLVERIGDCRCWRSPHFGQRGSVTKRGARRVKCRSQTPCAVDNSRSTVALLRPSTTGGCTSSARAIASAALRASRLATRSRGCGLERRRPGDRRGQ